MNRNIIEKILGKLDHSVAEYAVRDITFLTCTIFNETHKISFEKFFGFKNFSFIFWFIRNDGNAVFYRSGREYNAFAEKLGQEYLGDVKSARKNATILIGMSDEINDFIQRNTKLENLVEKWGSFFELYRDFFAYHQAMYWPSEYLAKIKTSENKDRIEKVISILDDAYKYNETVVPNVEKYFVGLGIGDLSWDEIIKFSKNELKIEPKRSSLLLDGSITILSRKEAQELNSAISDDYAEYLENKKEISGLAVSGGKVSGKVRLITDLKDLDKCEEGEILVTTQTRPQYNSFIKKVKAIVTDEGGMLCHASMLAREFKIPCIVGTKNVTKILHDGDLVEVDADQGIVRILDKFAREINQADLEKYFFVGRYQSSIFASWFWASWYSKELANGIGLELEYGGHLNMRGGNTFYNPLIFEQVRDFLHKKIDDADIGFFDNVISLAEEEFKVAMLFADSLTVPSKNLADDYFQIINHAQRMTFYWCLGYLLSEKFDPIMEDAALRAGIKADEIQNYLSLLDTPLMTQQTEAYRLKKMLVERELWNSYEDNHDKIIALIRQSADLNQIFEEHISSYGWIQMMNWTGEPLDLEKLIEQMSFINVDIDHQRLSEKKSPLSFKLYKDIAQRIAYLRQTGAEHSSILSYKALPLLRSIAKEARVSYREMLELTPDEIFTGGAVSSNMRDIIEKRKDDNWCIYTNADHSVEVIDDKEVVNDLAALLMPSAETDGVHELSGQIGNKGKAIGPVRVILATDDFHKMQDGDVLVAPMTTPDFVILMQRSIAIVTDMGGLLCHAAIVAREMKKPCIIGTKIATKVLKDGDEVEVDADKGVVKILEEANNISKGVKN
jgi:phosphohistidine swiveling domain-containing protein